MALFFSNKNKCCLKKNLTATYKIIEKATFEINFFSVSLVSNSLTLRI
jgi:hypothetical protein